MYQLYIANKNYSSWSLRPWVLLTELGIKFEERLEAFEAADNFEKFREFSPSGTVPCLVESQLDDGPQVVWDSLAITEYVAEDQPKVWPADKSARSFARCVAAEMHSSFSHLRNICPMNCAITVEMYEISPGLARDIHRIDEIWQEGLKKFGGPFVAGDSFTAADAFFCPVAYRVKSYQLPMSANSLAYVDRLLGLASMQAWDAAAISEGWREQAHEEEARMAGKVIHDRRA